MDPATWRLTLRSSPFYSTPLEYIIGLPLILPLIFLLFDLWITDQNYSYFMTILQTIGISCLAFYTSDKLIESFQGTLEKKGLFGRDLNKAGEQKDKKPVPEALGIVTSIVFMITSIQ